MDGAVSRKEFQAAVDDFFSGKISVDEAFRRAYGDCRETDTNLENGAPNVTPLSKRRKDRKSRKAHGRW